MITVLDENWCKVVDDIKHHLKYFCLGYYCFSKMNEINFSK